MCSRLSFGFFFFFYLLFFSLSISAAFGFKIFENMTFRIRHKLKNMTVRIRQIFLK
jgi:hypothetical protein